MLKIALVTACSKNMMPGPSPAIQLYRSARIKAVNNRKSGCDMFILSGKYNLIKSDEIISQYTDVMNEEKAKKFAHIVARKLTGYDVVIYFRGGAREAYLKCIKEACVIAKKPLIVVGYAHLGGINDLPRIIQEAKAGNFTSIKAIAHVSLYSNRSLQT